MKKTIIAIAAVMFLASCGGSNSQTVETTQDSVGVDSSNINSTLIDSVKVDTLKADTVSVEPTK